MQSPFDELYRRLSRELKTVAVNSWSSAQLSAGNSSFMLPSPAVALMELEPAACMPVPAGTTFESERAIGRGGEASFSVIGDGHRVHAWSVDRAAWIFVGAQPGEGGAVARPLARGFQVHLVREARVAAGERALRLLVRSEPLVLGALRGSHVRSGHTILPCRPVSLPLSIAAIAPELPNALFDVVDAETRDLVEIDIPRIAGAQDRLELQFLFADPVPLKSALRTPDIRLNVVPVWNAMHCTYPAPHDAERIFGEGARRLVHPLRVDASRPGWRPFAVLRAGAADDSRIAFRFGSFPAQAPGYLLAFVPAGARENGRDILASGGSGGSRLAVVLTSEARQMLDEKGKRLVIEYLATAGSTANGIEAGTTLLETRAGWISGRVPLRGALVTRSRGGADGVSLELVEQMACGGAQGLLHRSWGRRIADTVWALQSFFEELELVDERDLLRQNVAGGVTELMARVRIRDNLLDARERAALLTSAASFLQRYLGTGLRLRLVEVDHVR